MMKKLIISAAVLSALGYLATKNTVCFSTQWDKQERFYCTKGWAEVSHLRRMSAANETVWAYSDTKGLEDFGSYNVCLALSKPIKYTGYSKIRGNFETTMDLITDEHPVEIQDACALILYGGEY